MIAREILIFAGAAALFASAIAAYLAAFHGGVSTKDVLSTTAAALVGLYAGRHLERKIARG